MDTCGGVNGCLSCVKPPRPSYLALNVHWHAGKKVQVSMEHTCKVTEASGCVSPLISVTDSWSVVACRQEGAGVHGVFPERQKGFRLCTC